MHSDTSKQGRVLIIAGSDPSGGAGIQADIKTVTALGGYAMTAITALTVQDTKGVYDVMPVSPDFIAAQIKTCIADIGVDAIKIGMIGSVETGEAILAGLKDAGWEYPARNDAHMIPLILDPVLIATSGDQLSGEGVTDFIVNRFLPISYLITPNLMEAEALCGFSVQTKEQQYRAGEKLLELGAKNALVKGGHGADAVVRDFMIGRAGSFTFENPRIETSSTHGTGCTLASALATGLAQGLPVKKTTARAIAYVRAAIETAPGFGAGHGPLNHAHTVLTFTVDDDK